MRLGLFSWHDGRVERLRSAQFSSLDYDDLESIVQVFLGEQPPALQAAAFGVAGPVQAGVAQVTNLPWTVSADELRRRFAITRVRLINDLEATAYGVMTLDESDLAILNQGAESDGSLAVIAAGTGLGEGYLFWDGVRHHPAPSEGGHADFAPRTDLEVELQAFLRRRFGRVSYERVLSGPGLVNIYEFLRDTGRGDETPELAAAQQDEDRAAVISCAALDGSSELCVRALDLFVRIYGAEAGNLALKVLATGGVYVAGGIAAKIRVKLADGTFMRAFSDKGRMRSVLDKIPVRVVLNQEAPLNGAGYCAARMLHREKEELQ